MNMEEKYKNALDTRTIQVNTLWKELKQLERENVHYKNALAKISNPNDKDTMNEWFKFCE